MMKNGEIRNVVSKLAKLGVQATITQSRVELSKTLSLPQPPQVQSRSS